MSLCKVLFIRVPYYLGYLKRDYNFENYPYVARSPSVRLSCVQTSLARSSGLKVPDSAWESWISVGKPYDVVAMGPNP